MIRMVRCEKQGIVKHKMMLVCESCTAENSGTQPTDKQQRKGKICARCSKDTPLALDILSLYDFKFCPWCGRKLSPVA